QGDRDLQVSVADAERLHSARRDADLIVITGMNHVLKAVGADIESNQRAYTDPNVPIASGFVEAITRFVEEVSR
ncbi:MAG: alpha/beta hydrolase, partial [Spirochaetaceae bacterium]